MPDDWADFGPSSDTEIEVFIDDGEIIDDSDIEVVIIDDSDTQVVVIDGPGDETVSDESGSEVGVPDPWSEPLAWSDQPPAPPEQALAHVETILDQVERALTRLDDGTYGQCLSCGSLIDDNHLDASPTREACSSCTPVGA